MVTSYSESMEDFSHKNSPNIKLLLRISAVHNFSAGP